MSDVLHDIPKPILLNDSEIRSIAEKSRKDAISIKTGFHIKPYLRSIGWEINNVYFYDEVPSASLIVSPNKPVRLYLFGEISSIDNHLRMAEAFGHYVLHRYSINNEKQIQIPWSHIRDNIYLNIARKQARIFALSFLMPRDEFIEAYKNGVASDLFAVRNKIVSERAKELCL